MYLLSSNCLPLLCPSKHFLLDTPMHTELATYVDLEKMNFYDFVYIQFPFLYSDFSIFGCTRFCVNTSLFCIIVQYSGFIRLYLDC